MAYRKSLDFLPGVFRTETNDKFLHATLDQMISEPDLRRFDGYVGRKFSPISGNSDSFIQESSRLRQDYQLEPATVFVDRDDKVRFSSSYIDLLRRIDSLGGITTDPNRLFSSDYYSYDGFIDYDKFLNYSSYYWIPNGPDPVSVFSRSVPFQQDFTVTPPTEYQVVAGRYDLDQYDARSFDTSENDITLVRQSGIKFDVTGQDQNPTIRLARGGTYRFLLDQKGHGFFIQSEFGTTDDLSWQQNLSAREVLGVENNGAESGVLTFRVPQKDEQDYFLSLDSAGASSFVAHSYLKSRALRYNELQLKNYQDLVIEHGGLDGISSIIGGTVVFLDDPVLGSIPQPWQANSFYAEGALISYGSNIYRVLSDFTTSRTFNTYNLEIYDLGDSWYDPQLFDATDEGFDSVAFDRGPQVSEENRRAKFLITITDEGFIKLIPKTVVARNQKTHISNGIKYGNRKIYRDANDSMKLVPAITANLDRLFYCDAIDPNIGGVIEIIDQGTDLFLDVNEILGKLTYVSPNGVRLTNGMKIRFIDDALPSEYRNKEYYVEGVGTGINLVPVDELVTNEPWLDTIEYAFDMQGYDTEEYSGNTNAPLTPDYIVINRSSIEKSAWTRHNRWFHEDVIYRTAEYNNYPSTFAGMSKARRPIIEFDPNLQLFDFGKVARTPVTIIDTQTTDAFSQVEGTAITVNDEGVFGYYSDSIPLTQGMRVIFANDTDLTVRSTIYKVEWIIPQSSTEDRIWSFDADGSTLSYSLGTEISDTTRLSVFIDGVLASLAGYQYSYIGSTESIDFVSAVPDGAVITVELKYDRQIHLVPDGSRIIEKGETVYSQRGLQNQGKMFYFDGNSWRISQQKTKVNQAPLFDLYDADGNSFSNRSIYISNDFSGNKLFSYQTGSGAKDPVLGLRLKYRNIDNIGDILFEDSITKGKIIYRNNQISETKSLAGARARINSLNGTVSYRSQWTRAREKSKQFQLQTYYATEYQKNLFKLNVLPEGAGADKLKNIIVYVNNKALITSDYNIQNEANSSFLLLANDLSVGDKLDIKLYSKIVNSESVFEIPNNYDRNPFNQEVSDITLGQMRSHILSAYEKISNLEGSYIGKNNSRDLGNIKDYGGKILQHDSAPHLANFFMNDAQANFIESVVSAQREYIRFKNRFLESAKDLAFDVIGSVSDAVDYIINDMTLNKNKNFAFFTSDMIPFGNDYVALRYTIIDDRLKEYDLSDIFNKTVASNKAILVYLNDRQLVFDIDYEFIIDSPIVRIKKVLAEGDVLEIREYSNTDGCYVPSTPTKLGMYPSFVPARVIDGYGEYAQEMLRGHDGSLTVLFGDNRDDILLEFETRIYNNLKVEYDRARFDIFSYLPGAFRNTEYSKSEYLSILSAYFSAWLGANSVIVSDYRQFDANDPFTFNYGNFTNRLDGKVMPAANWRGLYYYYYDTCAPHLRPWEMLGFSDQPDWWENYYGPAPYTSGNEILWNDIERGYIAEGVRKGTDPVYSRPGLKSIIPVNENGELLDPYRALVKDGYKLDLSGFYEFGDGGPVENAWRNSSEYPFALQLALAMMAPGAYFGKNIDNNLQKLVDNRLVFIDTMLKSIDNRYFHDESTELGMARTDGYITWISDYCKSRGFDITSTIGNRLRNLSTRLAYKVQGYTDKKYLKITTEQYSPGSKNPGIIIPDDDFDIVLSKSSPTKNLTYSGVIVTKTVDGYAINGYDDNKPYFNIVPSSINANKVLIKVGNLAVTKYKNGTGKIVSVPYGTEFYSVEEVAEFLLCYGRCLESQGFLFTDKLDDDASWVQDWDLSVREFLFFVQQNWEVDVAITLSPVGQKINYRSDLGVVDSISNRPYNSRVIDEDFKIVRPEDYTVYRNGRDFNLKINDARGIYLIDLDIVEYEHMIIFENKTRFNDIVFDPITGDRQHRLKFQGFKTSGWDGSYGAPGFIINEDNISDWQPGVNYHKGDIVLNDGKYYTASGRIAASLEFETGDWIESDYDRVKKGLLPNLANRAGLSKKFYDVNDVNLESDADILAKNLIGFENRDYMVDLGLTDTSQFKFYQGMLSQKGTNNSLDKLLNAKLDNFDGSADIYEEWALKVGSYGATSSTKNLRFVLDEKFAIKDPLIIEILDNNDTRPKDWIGITRSDILETPVPFDKNFLGVRSKNNYSTDLPTAGYARLDDADYTSPTRASLNIAISDNENIGDGDYVWVAADRNNKWNIYRVSSTDTRLESIVVNSRGIATIKCRENHKLEQFDLIYIKSANIVPDFAGFFEVTSILDSRTFTSATTLGPNNISPAIGIVHKLIPMRFDDASQIAEREPTFGWKIGDRLFVDSTNRNTWGVYEKTLGWTDGSEYMPPDPAAGDLFGQSLASSVNNDILIAGRPGDLDPTSGDPRGGVLIYAIDSDGTLQLKANLAASSDNISDFGKTVAASDFNVLAAGAPLSDDIGFVYVIDKDREDDSFRISQALASPDLDANGEFGAAIAISNDEQWLVVGQPGAVEGYIYVYQRKILTVPAPVTQDFVGDGSTVAFTLTGDASNPNSVSALLVIKDKVTLEPTTDYTLSGNDVIFPAAPAIGSSISVTVTRDDPELEFTGDGSTDTFTLTGDSANLTSIYALFVEVDGKIMIPFRDYSIIPNGSLYDLVLTVAPALNVKIKVTQRNHYELVEVLSGSDSVDGDRFGSSLALSDNARQILVGAPNKDGDVATSVGAVYIYDRTSDNFFADGETTSFTTSQAIQGTTRVYIDGIPLIENDGYTVVVNTVVFDTAPSAGSVIKINSNNFNETIILTPNSAGDDEEDAAGFGSSISICATNCSVYIGSPFRDTDKTDSGKVYRFINQGRAYGDIIGTEIDPIISIYSVLKINDFNVVLQVGWSLEQVIDAINSTNIPGVSASSDTEGKIVISSNSLITGEKLLIYALVGSALDDLGLEIYAHQQTILAPTDEDYAEFGKTVEVGPTSDYLVIGSSRASSRLQTYFDDNQTYFDSTSTTFNDLKKNSGAAWVYQYIGTPSARVSNPGKFIPALKLTDSKIDSLDQFGSSISINRKRIYIGAPGDDTNAINSGLVFSYDNSGVKTWQLTREEVAKVDIDLINRVYLYNRDTNEVLVDLDFIDPSKNKISGIAAQEITYTSSYDPATYSINDSGNVWGKEQVGQIWWDTSQIRWLDFEQGDLAFRGSNWNTAFPGSTALCYEWVESLTPPATYFDLSNPRSFARSNESITRADIDPVTGITTTYYYFWVAGKETSDKNYSPVALEGIIANPRTSGIPFVAMLAPNAIALYNVSNYLNGDNTVIVIDYDVKKNTNSIHTEYQLISEGDARSIPNYKILDKLVDSLSGIDPLGNLVPDISLSLSEKYGIAFRPRQSMVRNRNIALKNAVTYINRVLLTIPVVDSKNLVNVRAAEPIPDRSSGLYNDEVNDFTELSYLITAILPDDYRVLVKNDETVRGRWTIYSLTTDKIWKLVQVQAYDCSQYVTLIDWVKPGIDDPIVTDFVVDYSYQLSNLSVETNQTVKIKNAGDGRYVIARLTSAGEFEIIKRQSATIKISDTIWNQSLSNHGFDTETFDVQLFDEWSAEEARRTLISIYTDIFNGLEEIEKNRFFFKMLEYSLAEQKYVDWAFKTSFLKIEHTNQQAISQIPILQRDRQDSLRKYIEEVKPYHSKIREFINTHASQDQALEYLTDFDLPVYYSPTFKNYRPVTGKDSYESVVLGNYPWKAWADNHALGIESVVVLNGGEYLAAPKLTVLGGDGDGAKIRAKIAAGTITEIIIDDPGEYLSTPYIEVKFGDAILIPIMGNKKVRSMKTSLKFDRVANNGGFLVQFLDSFGEPVDIREQRKSRIFGQHGVIDDLLDALSLFEWLKDEEENIGYPVPGVSNYRIFDDTSGRIQVQYKKTPGGWTAQLLQDYLRGLAVSGIDEIDIGGTTVTVDGNMMLYAPSIFDWEPSTRYDIGDIIVYNNKAYTPTIVFTSDEEFNTDHLRVYGSEEFESHINRTWAYYQPKEGMFGRDIGQLISGTEYPGVKIQGPNFNQEPGFDVGRYDTTAFDQYIIGPEGVAILDPKILDQTIYSNFLDTSLGTRPEDINIVGGGFVDIYSSHAPEEMVPGRTYDTVDIKVYTVPSDSWDGRDLGLDILLSSRKIGSDIVFEYTPTATGSDTLIVFSRFKQRLSEGVDYTADRANNTISLIGSYLPDDSLFVYAIDGGGQGLLYDSEFVGDGITKSYLLQITRDLVTQALITIDGVRQTGGFILDSNDQGLAILKFVSAPADGASIHVHLFNTDDSIQRFVEVHTQDVNFDTTPIYPTGYTISLDRASGFDSVLDDKIIVELDGLRLRPSNQAYYTGDSSTLVYALPDTAYIDPVSITESEIRITIDGVKQIANIHWVLDAFDGSTVPMITFVDEPVFGSKIVISLITGAEYRLIDNRTLLLDESLDIQANSKLTITTFTDNSYLGIRTQVFQGTTAETITQPIGFDIVGFDATPLDNPTFTSIQVKEYELSRAINNISYTWVTVAYEGSGGGIHLKPNIDYTLETPTRLRLADNLNLTTDTIVVITHFSEETQKPAIGFRIFKDLNDNIQYYRISAENSTKIARTVSTTDTEIFVDDAIRLAEPNIDLAIPGKIIVGGEVIHYYVRDLANNRLAQIRRGVAGTGAVSTIPENTTVYDISQDQIIPDAHNKIWYNTGIASASDGLGLQNSTTEQAKFLLEKPTLLDSQVFDPAYMQSGYVQAGYVEGNIFK